MIKADENTSIIEIMTNPDKEGKQTFFIYWYDPNNIFAEKNHGYRGQVFHAHLSNYVKKIIENKDLYIYVTERRN